MDFRISLPEEQLHIDVAAGMVLLEALRQAGCIVDAPCGGHGTCGKCKVWVNGEEVLACRTVVDRAMTVILPKQAEVSVLTTGIPVPITESGGYRLAFDIGTTTVAGFLLNGKGEELASESRENPQRAFGADVISRIQYALKTDGEIQTNRIRACLSQMTAKLCEKCGVLEKEIQTVSVVGNPAMEQLFLGISPENLARIPFAPVLTRLLELPAREYIPSLCEASLRIAPNISGYVGGDTVACILAAGLDEQTDWTLLVDIGTNGEMVLGRKDRIIACSTAAGPALEGANISCGMRGQPGAIDHIWLECGKLCYSVIGGVEAEGICGSGLIDAAAVALELGLINQRGRVQTEDHCIPITDRVVLTQDDIRQLQLAKGAISAGISLMAEQLGIDLTQIRKVFLAGAFGTFMDPVAACRMGCCRWNWKARRLLSAMLPVAAQSCLPVMRPCQNGWGSFWKRPSFWNWLRWRTSSIVLQ